MPPSTARPTKAFRSTHSSQPDQSSKPTEILPSVKFYYQTARPHLLGGNLRDPKCQSTCKNGASEAYYRLDAAAGVLCVAIRALTGTGSHWTRSCSGQLDSPILTKIVTI